METVTVLDTPEEIDAFRCLALGKGLGLECLGMKRRGESCYSIIKREFNLRGSKTKVLEQFRQLMKDRGILT